MSQKLAIPQLLALSSDAGFSGDDLVTAVAVALAESGGNPQAYNPERAAGAPSGKGSFGLWQIYLQAHPEFAGQNLLDPGVNSAAAYAIYSAAGNSFTPWSTYKAGSYLAQLDAVNAALSASQDQTQVADASGGTDTSGDGGSGPSGGELAAWIAGGALALWAIYRVIGA